MSGTSARDKTQWTGVGGGGVLLYGGKVTMGRALILYGHGVSGGPFWTLFVHCLPGFQH